MPNIQHQYIQLPPPQYPRFEISAGLGVMSRGPGEASEHTLASMGFRESYLGPRMTRPRLDGLFKMDIGVSRHRSVGFSVREA